MRRAILAWGIVATVVIATDGTFAFQSGRGAKPAVQSPRGQPVTKAQPATRSSKGRQSVPASTQALSPLQRQLQRNPDLAARLTERLPKGFKAMPASSGFRNLGQFVAAVTASNNLEIPFVTLKKRMIDDRMSLGQAIRNLRPSADYRAEVRRAERDAAAIIGK
jgi:hypothetical protein